MTKRQTVDLSDLARPSNKHPDCTCGRHEDEYGHYRWTVNCGYHEALNARLELTRVHRGQAE